MDIQMIIICIIAYVAICFILNYSLDDHTPIWFMVLCIPLNLVAYFIFLPSILKEANELKKKDN